MNSVHSSGIRTMEIRHNGKRSPFDKWNGIEPKLFLQHWANFGGKIAQSTQGFLSERCIVYDEESSF